VAATVEDILALPTAATEVGVIVLMHGVKTRHNRGGDIRTALTRRARRGDSERRAGGGLTDNVARARGALAHLRLRK